VFSARNQSLTGTAVRLYTVEAASCGGIQFDYSTKPTKVQSTALKSGVQYQDAGEVMEKYVRRALDFKAGKLERAEPPLPTLLNFEMAPVYTCGRRERGKLSSAEVEHFKAGGKAQFVETFRGGQTTFHGPGQLVVYPVLDLRAFGIPPKCYVSLLEKSIINTLARYDIEAKTTQDTGVWINDQEKIAAIGIHCRRNVTSHGIALNVNTDTWWFDRIVACGLPDKSTTSMANLGVKTSVSEVSRVFSQEMAKALECELLCID
jgi:lipoate-protein ligase B